MASKPKSTYSYIWRGVGLFLLLVGGLFLIRGGNEGTILFGWIAPAALAGWLAAILARRLRLAKGWRILSIILAALLAGGYVWLRAVAYSIDWSTINY